MPELLLHNLTAGYRGHPAVRGVSLRVAGGRLTGTLPALTAVMLAAGN